MSSLGGGAVAIDAAIVIYLIEEHPTFLPIILPLFGSGYDASSAIDELERLKYAGRITVIAPSLPRPSLVERELRALGPGARLTLISP